MICLRAAFRSPRILNSFLPSTIATDLLTLTARNLRTLRPIRLALDAATVTSVIALLSQRLLGSANCTATARHDSPKADFTTFQAIQCRSLGYQSYGLISGLTCNMAPAPWLELDGSLLAVNAAAPMNALKGDEEEMRRMRGYARDVSGGLASEAEGGKGCCGTEDQLAGGI